MRELEPGLWHWQAPRVEAFPGRAHNDLVLWIESRRAVVAGDALADFGRGFEIPREVLQHGATREQVAAGLRPLLALPVELVLPAHGVPTDRGALERALSGPVTANPPSARARCPRRPLDRRQPAYETRPSRGKKEIGSLAAPKVGVRLEWLAVLLAATPLFLAACSWSGSESSATATAPLELPAPEGLTGMADGFSVVLTWRPPSEGAEIVGYEITRDGSRLDSVDPEATTFTDYNLEPGSYRYAVRANGPRGTSPPVATDVVIKAPPLEAARLEGRYRVKTKMTSKKGYANLGAIPSFEWDFEPKCREGACDVVWRDLLDKRIRATLNRRKATYTGHYKGVFLATCRGTRSVSSVHVVIDAVKARAVGGIWRVAKFDGTVRSREAPQLGCVSGRAVQAIKGVLRRGG